MKTFKAYQRVRLLKTEKTTEPEIVKGSIGEVQQGHFPNPDYVPVRFPGHIFTAGILREDLEIVVD